VLIGKLVKIALLLTAAGVALTLLGIDFTALTFLAGALGLGIGFGLQKVVSNFVSGIIILLDKSIKPGDTIAIGDTFGWVRSLRARFVSVITRDGREYLIPNEDFVTQRVENWSFTDTLVRIDVTFGVDFDSNPHDVRRMAVDAVKAVSRVQEQPSPVCHLTGFGESSLDFVLRFWIADPQNGVTNVKGAVLLACWDAFKSAGIGFPYPHRHLVAENPLPVRVVQGAS
jgi:small-conductance mechanosensitive channel